MATTIVTASVVTYHLDAKWRPSGRANMCDISISFARTREELEKCASLFVEAGSELRGYFLNTDAEKQSVIKEYKKFKQSVLAARLGNNIVGTQAVALERSQGSLPIDQIFPEARELKDEGRAQITTFATDPHLECGQKVFLPLMAKTLLVVRASGVRNLLIGVNPRHSLWYTHRIGFTPIANGEIRMHPHIQNAQVIGLRYDMSQLSRNKYIVENLHRYA